jgi:thiol-disulfide isomerase/thioredoxin
VSTPWIVVMGVESAALVLLALLVIGLLRRVTFVLEQAESHLGELATAASVSPAGGLAPGELVPPAAAVRQSGAPFDTQELVGEPSLVLFLSSTCAPCKELSRQLRRRAAAAETVGARLLVVVRDEHEAHSLELAGVELVYQPDFALSRAFETSATPHAFAIDAEGIVVGSSTPNTLGRLRELGDVARRGGEAIATTRTSAEVPL